MTGLNQDMFQDELNEANNKISTDPVDQIPVEHIASVLRILIEKYEDLYNETCYGDRPYGDAHKEASDLLGRLEKQID